MRSTGKRVDEFSSGGESFAPSLSAKGAGQGWGTLMPASTPLFSGVVGPLPPLNPYLWLRHGHQQRLANHSGEAIQHIDEA